MMLASSKEVPGIASSCVGDLQTRRLDQLAPYQLTNDFDKFSSLIFFFFSFLFKGMFGFLLHSFVYIPIKAGSNYHQLSCEISYCLVITVLIDIKFI